MMVVHKDLRVPMRDGIQLAADAYHAEGDMPRPALVALSPYGKELQALALTLPPQRRPSPLWDGCIEAGDIARVVKEGYVHVIGDVRGSGGSEENTSATTTPVAFRSDATHTISLSGLPRNRGATAWWA